MNFGNLGTVRGFLVGWGIAILLVGPGTSWQFAIAQWFIWPALCAGLGKRWL